MFTARTMALWNVTGLPSVAVPIGFGDDGLPIGMQVAGPAFADETLPRRCCRLPGSSTDHHRCPPRLEAGDEAHYEFAEHDTGTNQGLLSQLVVPRPIAMVSTRDAEGIGNLSPFSYYLPITGEPPLVGVTFGMRSSDGLTKHSYDNLTASGDFVINVCTEMFAEHIESIAKEYPPGTDEAEVHGFTLVAAQQVSAPAVAEALAHLECRVHQTVPLGSEQAAVVLVVAEVVCAVIDDVVLESPDLDHPRIDLHALAPIGRSGVRTFIRTIPDAVSRTPPVRASQCEPSESSSERTTRL